MSWMKWTEMRGFSKRLSCLPYRLQFHSHSHRTQISPGVVSIVFPYYDYLAAYISFIAFMYILSPSCLSDMAP